MFLAKIVFCRNIFKFGNLLTASINIHIFLQVTHQSSGLLPCLSSGPWVKMSMSKKLGCRFFCFFAWRKSCERILRNTDFQRANGNFLQISRLMLPELSNNAIEPENNEYLFIWSSAEMFRFVFVRVLAKKFSVFRKFFDVFKKLFLNAHIWKPRRAIGSFFERNDAEGNGNVFTEKIDRKLFVQLGFLYEKLQTLSILCTYSVFLDLKYSFKAMQNLVSQVNNLDTIFWTIQRWIHKKCCH